MDSGTVIALVAAVIGLVAAAAAWWQAAAAAGSRKDAKAAQEAAESARDEALDLSRKAASAAERQASAMEQALPPAWSQARAVSENAFAFDNTSGRHIVVTSVDGHPSKFANMLRAPQTPTRVEYGDALPMSHWRSLAGGIDMVTIGWHFEGDPASQQQTERRI